MKAKLLYFDVEKFFINQEEDYYKYKKEDKIKTIKARVCCSLMILMIIILLTYSALIKEDSFVIGIIEPIRTFINQHYFFEMIMLLLWCVVFGIIVLYGGILTFNDMCYSNYKTFDEFVASKYNLRFIKLLNDNKFISAELHRTQKNYFNLQFAYELNGEVIEECYDREIEIKPRTDVDELWLDVKLDYLYIPYDFYKKLSCEEIISVDTFFAEDNGKGVLLR